MTAPDAGTVTPPWPDVSECYYPAPSLVAAGHTCPQCDGSHDHEWVAWHDVPHGAYKRDGKPRGLPVRCRVCGGRKCDRPTCPLRRHHGGDHERY